MILPLRAPLWPLYITRVCRFETDGEAISDNGAISGKYLHILHNIKWFGSLYCSTEVLSTTTIIGTAPSARRVSTGATRSPGPRGCGDTTGPQVNTKHLFIHSPLSYHVNIPSIAGFILKDDISAEGNYFL